MKISKSKIEKVKTLCEKHEVTSLYLFGSATGDKFTEKSDIDFLVAFKKIELSEYFSNFLSLKESLKNLFHREIDLIEEQALKNPVLIASINRNKQLIYG